MNQFIINRPDLQSFRQKYGYSSITVLLWAAYIYMWLPLISLAAWFFGVHLFYEHVVERGGYQAFLSDIRRYAVVIAVLVGVYVSWAIINYLRFRNSRRRSGPRTVSAEALAHHFRIGQNEVAILQAAKVVELRHDEGGNVIAIRPIAVRTRSHADPAPGWPRRLRRPEEQPRRHGKARSAAFSRRRRAAPR